MKKIEKVDVIGTVLGIIGVAGFISLTLVAPNVFQILKFLKKNNRRYRSQYYLEGVIGKLQKKGLIAFERRNDQLCAYLTEKGSLELLKRKMRGDTGVKKKWDGKWRVVTFDVKERKRGTRDKMRYDLASFGFARLQKSVWVYPYDCEDIVILLKADYRIGTEVLYLLVEKIENDNWLRKKFGLNS